MIETPITLKGTAQNAKQGAILLTDDGMHYYLAGKDTWEPHILNQNITIQGILKELVADEAQILKDKQGNYRSGAIGTQSILIDWQVK